MSRRLKREIRGRDFRIYSDEYGEPASLERWEEIFAPDVKPPLGLVVDIGFGRGEFLLEMAQKEPTRAFIGIERSFKRTLKMAHRLVRFGVANVRLVEAMAESGVSEMLPENSIETAWINFPDPWPKDRHARRRLIQPPFVQALARRLTDGGSLYVATDDSAYSEQIAGVLAREPLLENIYAPDPFRPEAHGRTPTAYELEWRALGRNLHYFAYKRKRRVGGA